MGIDIQIKLKFTPMQSRLLRGAIIGGAVIGSVGLGLAVAQPHQWQANQTLQAVDLNSLNVLDGGAGGTYSVGATRFCGITAPTQGDLSGVSGVGTGYVHAKHACEAVAACGNSLTAHMCTGDEVSRGLQLHAFASLTSAHYWYSHPVAVPNGGTTYMDECKGWTSNVGGTSADVAQTIFIDSSGNGQPNNEACDKTVAILCCD